MKLHQINFSLGVFSGREGVVCFACGAKSGSQRGNMVAVAIPDTHGLRESAEEIGSGWLFDQMQLRAAVFTALGLFDGATQRPGHPLHSITDPEDGNAK